MALTWAKWALPALILGTSPAWADTIELINGDRVQGTVQNLNDSSLQLSSELLGDLSVPRDRIRVIYFGAAPPVVKTSPPAAAGAASAETPEALIEKLTGKSVAPPGGASGGNQEILNQLQKQGLDAGAISEVQKTFPLLAVPEVGAHFQKNLSGLMSGSLDIQDIRKQAIEARDMLNDLKQDLGPEAAALNGYLGILDRFIKETGSTEESPSHDATPKR